MTKKGKPDVTDKNRTVAAEQRTVNTTTFAGMQEAERLQAQGWTAVRVGLFYTTFWKRKPGQ